MEFNKSLKELLNRLVGKHNTEEELELKNEFFSYSGSTPKRDLRKSSKLFIPCILKDSNGVEVEWNPFYSTNNYNVNVVISSQNSTIRPILESCVCDNHFAGISDSIVFAPMVEYPSLREDSISIFEGEKVNYNLDFLSVLNPDDIDVDLLANLVNTYIESLFTLCFETNFPKKNLAIDLRFKRFMYHCHERISSYIINRESYSTVSLIEWLRCGYVPDQIDYFSLIFSTMPELEQVYDPSMPSVYGVTNHLVIDSCELAGMNVQHLVSVTIPLVALYNQYKSEKLKPMFILNEHLGTPKQENICSLISRHFKQKAISYIHVVNGAQRKNGIFSLYATNLVYETINETSFINDYQEIVLKEKFAA
ncbi:hypothetical protein [Vibrio cyclitrophicus]|uniref:hypothetical protein n=1 Tax=Vibrio cyclitrophicus TaxID=47951 RepID=UPI0032E4C3BC